MAPIDFNPNTEGAMDPELMWQSYLRYLGDDYAIHLADDAHREVMQSEADYLEPMEN